MPGKIKLCQHRVCELCICPPAATMVYLLLPLIFCVHFGGQPRRARRIVLPGFGSVRFFAKSSEPRTLGQVRFGHFAEPRTAPGVRCTGVQMGFGNGSNCNKPEFCFSNFCLWWTPHYLVTSLPTSQTRASTHLAAAGHERDITRDARDGPN
jgi:hypothetical protein